MVSGVILIIYIMPRTNKGLFFGKQNFQTGMAASFNVGIDTRYEGNFARFAVTQNQQNICNAEASGSYKAINNTVFVPGAWYHIAITYKNGTMKLYVNGKLKSSSLTTFTKINNCINGQFVVGGWWQGDLNGFDGKMSSIRIYTRALQDEEIDYLFRRN